MIPIDYEMIKIFNDKITLTSNGKTLVLLKDVWAIGYKKCSFANWLSMKYHWMAMGILYIGTKSAKRVQDLIPIIMPFSIVKKLPKSWLSKIEFYDPHTFIEIENIRYRL